MGLAPAGLSWWLLHLPKDSFQPSPPSIPSLLHHQQLLLRRDFLKTRENGARLAPPTAKVEAWDKVVSPLDSGVPQPLGWAGL